MIITICEGCSRLASRVCLHGDSLVCGANLCDDCIHLAGLSTGGIHGPSVSLKINEQLLEHQRATISRLSEELSHLKAHYYAMEKSFEDQLAKDHELLKKSGLIEDPNIERGKYVRNK